MDKKTQYELNKITRQLPSSLKTSITKTVVDDSQERAVKEMINSGKLSSKQKDNLKRMVDQGAFRSEETVVDEKKVKAIDRYYDQKVKAAIKSGKIPHPDKDKYFKDRMDRLRHRQ